MDPRLDAVCFDWAAHQAPLMHPVALFMFAVFAMVGFGLGLAWRK